MENNGRDKMKNYFLITALLFVPTISYAYTLMPTTFAMACYVISPDEKWTYRDYGFELTYKSADGKKQTLSAQSTGTKKNCTKKSVSVTGKIPPGPVKIKINDFAGEAGSTIECTNIINYKLTPQQVGKMCEFIVKTPKYGSYTSTDECTIQVTCGNQKSSNFEKLNYSK